MPDKRILIVPAELVKKIDENRGDTTQAEFLEFLIDSQLKEKVKEPTGEKQYVTKEDFDSFQEDIKKLLKTSLDFSVSYGLEIGKESPKTEFEELTAKLHELEDDTPYKDKRAKIKWK